MKFNSRRSQMIGTITLACFCIAVMFQNCGGGIKPFESANSLSTTNHSLTGVLSDPPLQFSFALGQPDFASVTKSQTLSASTLTGEENKFHYDGKHFIVSDFEHSRVLIWNQRPSNFNEPADLVLGQSDMASGECNRGQNMPSANTLCYPGGVFSDGVKLFVTDYSNGRVLIWNSFPTENGQPADVVLGKSDFNSDTSLEVTDKDFLGPWHVSVSANKLIVTDYDNHRVLIWDSIPHDNYTSANIVVGQPDFASYAAARNPPTASGMYHPYEAISDGTHLIVTDEGNQRVLIWNQIPTQNGQSADAVLGQSDFSSSLSPTTATESSLKSPKSVYIHRNKLYILDSGFRRVLVWNQIPTQNGQPAHLVYGQTSMTSVDPVPTQFDERHLNTYAEGLFVDDNMIVIGDPTNFRILILDPLYIAPM